MAPLILSSLAAPTLAAPTLPAAHFDSGGIHNLVLLFSIAVLRVRGSLLHVAYHPRNLDESFRGRILEGSLRWRSHSRTFLLGPIQILRHLQKALTRGGERLASLWAVPNAE